MNGNPFIFFGNALSYLSTILMHTEANRELAAKCKHYQSATNTVNKNIFATTGKRSSLIDQST